MVTKVDCERAAFWARIAVHKDYIRLCMEQGEPSEPNAVDWIWRNGTMADYQARGGELPTNWDEFFKARPDLVAFRHLTQGGWAFT